MNLIFRCLIFFLDCYNLWIVPPLREFPILMASKTIKKFTSFTKF